MSEQRCIDVCASWAGLEDAPRLVGQLTASLVRGKEIFAFEYAQSWLTSPQGRSSLDPGLLSFTGPQYPRKGRENFGLFLDSSPDRWGRLLMKRREALLARRGNREERRLTESDFLLGVHDSHRMGALRFRVDGRFMDDRSELASPPWTSLRELEQASRNILRDNAENDPAYGRWLRMLIAPGGSLGGARPKASVVDENGRLWIAKFPSGQDDHDIGAWEQVVHTLASAAGVDVPSAEVRTFGQSGSTGHHTYLSQRFDRSDAGERIHFASAMTLLDRIDGADADSGASYVNLADVLIQLGAQTRKDLEKLWRRIVFSVCVSNTDDHLRNHGFLFGPEGWTLSPAYDMNPNPDGEGLKLNISESDNAQDLDLVRDVAGVFRLKPTRAEEIIDEVRRSVRQWRNVAQNMGLAASAIDRMQRAFRVAER